MVSLPLDTFRKNKTASSLYYSSRGTVFLDGIPLYPADESIPVLESGPVTDNNSGLRFILHGNIALPTIKGCRWITISGIIEARKTDEPFFMIEKCDAISRLSDFSFDREVIITSGEIRLTTCRYHAHVQLTGELRMGNGGAVKAEAVINTPVQYVPNTAEECGISTLLSDATVRINKEITLRKGTIRFELFSTTRAAESLQRQFDENDELLYQFEEPMTIGNFEIVPIPEKPVTMAVALVSVPQTGLHLQMMVYPAQIRCNYIGEKTILFIHGNHYDEPFTIDTSGRWQASTSSNIFLQIIAPDDPSGKPLLESVTPVLGSFEAIGIGHPHLSLHAEMSTGTLLPDSGFPHPFSNRKIVIYIDENDTARCRFVIDELAVGNYCIRSTENEQKQLPIEISRDGLQMEKVVLCSDTSEKTEQKGSVIIQGDGRIVSEPEKQ